MRVHPKVAAGSTAGALAVVIVWALGLAHVTVPAPVAAALATLCAAALGWLAPARQADAQEPDTGVTEDVWPDGDPPPGDPSAALLDRSEPVPVSALPPLPDQLPPRGR